MDLQMIQTMDSAWTCDLIEKWTTDHLFQDLICGLHTFYWFDSISFTVVGLLKNAAHSPSVMHEYAPLMLLLTQCIWRMVRFVFVLDTLHFEEWQDFSYTCNSIINLHMHSSWWWWWKERRRDEESRGSEISQVCWWQTVNWRFFLFDIQYLPFKVLLVDSCTHCFCKCIFMHWYELNEYHWAVFEKVLHLILLCSCDTHSWPFLHSVMNSDLTSGLLLFHQAFACIQCANDWLGGVFCDWIGSKSGNVPWFPQ